MATATPATKRAKCPECKRTHEWTRLGTRSRASYPAGHKNGGTDAANGKLYGWFTRECNGPSAKEGKLYAEFS